MVRLKTIPREPLWTREMLRAGKNGGSFFPEGSRLFGYGRAALQKGLSVLGLRAGDDVLIPDYICHSIMPAFHELGIGTRFYPVGKELGPEWPELEKLIEEKTKALMAVNYFGFPGELETAREFCRRRGLFLIEDNAHGFLSEYNGRPLGSFGDISVTSFYKTICVPNGAALSLNDPSLRMKNVDMNGMTDRKNDLIFIAGQLQRRIGRPWRKRDTAVPSGPSAKEMEQELRLDGFRQPLSPLSGWILRRTDTEYIRQSRREGYLRWLRFLDENNRWGLEPVFPQLTDGVVPYVFPAAAQRRDEVMKEFHDKGIECFPWPYLPRASKEKYFSERMVCLPVFPAFDPGEYLK